MRKIALALAMLASLSTPASAWAEEGPLLVRLRAVYIVPADRSEAIPALSVPRTRSR